MAILRDVLSLGPEPELGATDVKLVEPEPELELLTWTGSLMLNELFSGKKKKGAGFGAGVGVA